MELQKETEFMDFDINNLPWLDWSNVFQEIINVIKPPKLWDTLTIWDIEFTITKTTKKKIKPFKIIIKQ